MNEITKELLQALKTATEFMWHGPGAQGAMEYANETIAKAEAAMAEGKPDADGWIKWDGGECPVPGGTLIDVTYRNGSVLHRVQAKMRNDLRVLGAEHAFWIKIGAANDIIAYRIVKEPQ